MGLWVVGRGPLYFSGMFRLLACTPESWLSALFGYLALWFLWFPDFLVWLQGAIFMALCLRWLSGSLVSLVT